MDGTYREQQPTSEYRNPRSLRALVEKDLRVREVILRCLKSGHSGTRSVAQINTVLKELEYPLINTNQLSSFITMTHTKLSPRLRSQISRRASAIQWLERIGPIDEEEETPLEVQEVLSAVGKLERAIKTGVVTPGAWSESEEVLDILKKARAVYGLTETVCAMIIDLGYTTTRGEQITSPKTLMTSAHIRFRKQSEGPKKRTASFEKPDEPYPPQVQEVISRIKETGIDTTVPWTQNKDVAELVQVMLSSLSKKKRRVRIVKELDSLGFRLTNGKEITTQHLYTFLNKPQKPSSPVKPQLAHPQSISPEREVTKPRVIRRHRVDITTWNERSEYKKRASTPSESRAVEAISKAKLDALQSRAVLDNVHRTINFVDVLVTALSKRQRAWKERVQSLISEVSPKGLDAVTIGTLSQKVEHNGETCFFMIPTLILPFSAKPGDSRAHGFSAESAPDLVALRETLKLLGGKFSLEFPSEVPQGEGVVQVYVSLEVEARGAASANKTRAKVAQYFFTVPGIKNEVIKTPHGAIAAE